MSAAPIDVAHLVSLREHADMEHETPAANVTEAWDEVLRESTRELVRHRRAQRAAAGLFDYYDDMARFCEARIAIAIERGGKL